MTMRLQDGAAIGLEPGHQRFVLWPHRSGSTALIVLLLATMTAGLAVPVVVIAGFAAWPLVVAALVTVVGVALAFWSNNMAARFREVIWVSPRSIHIERIGPATDHFDIRFDTHWARLTVETDRYVENRITIRESGRSYSPGIFLAPEERKSLADALRVGIHVACNRS